MKSTVEVQKKQFNDPETGRTIDYKRLVITGVIDGLVQTLEIKVTPLEATFAEMLLNADGEPAQVHTSKAKPEDILPPVRNEETGNDNPATSFWD